MAIALLWNLQSLWPFSAFRTDELRASKKLVNKLAIPNHTKQFVYAFRDPETKTLVYVLSATNLSERSAIDAQCLIREIRPDAVVVQGGRSPFPEIVSDEEKVEFDKALPTSPFGVVKRCFVDKIGREAYEGVACNFVLREIFGTSFHGHLLAAKKAAEDVGSSFIVIESSPLGKSSWGDSGDNDNGSAIDVGSRFKSLASSFVPQQHRTALKRFSFSDEVRAQMAKALSVFADVPLTGNTTGSAPEGDSGEIQPRSDYETPAYARSIYPLLEDLYHLFPNIPSFGKALAHVQKMLLDVNRGDVLDTRTVSEVYTFRIAVEGLRIALHSKGLQAINRKVDMNPKKVEYSELSIDEKSHVLFAHAVRSQADKFKTIVAVIDASTLAALRKHWHTPIPCEVKELVGQTVTNSDDEGAVSNHNDKKRLLKDNPMVAVGAGATAVLGASSLTKVVPASTVMKVVTFKIPASLKIVLSQMQKALAFALGPSKGLAPGIATSGAKSSSLLKTAVSAEKIRTVAHSVIASAERTSVSAMRTAFYEIMRKRKVRPVGFLPWATFAGSVGACSGLLLWGDGMEYAVESVPSAHSIASLGRGIQNLREVSQAVMQTEGIRIQNSIESLINRIKKARDR